MTLNELREALERDGWNIGIPTLALWATHPSGASVMVRTWQAHGQAYADVRVSSAHTRTYDGEIIGGVRRSHHVYASAYDAATNLTRNRA